MKFYCYALNYRLKRSAFAIIFVLLTASSGYSQSSDIYERYDIHRNPLRVFLNKFSFSFSLGYGLTEYKNDLSDFGFYQDSSNQIILRRDLEVGADSTGFSNWLTNPADDTTMTGNTLFGDTIGLAFQKRSGSIPISLSVHYNFRKLRAGAGFTFEQQFLKPLEPTG